MTDHAARLYALAAAVLVFFVAWVAVTARPWVNASASAATTDARVQALVVRQQRVQAEALAVRRVLAARKKAAPLASAAAPAPQPTVRVVTLPPLTITRTS
jgi:hypothetical protein